MKSKSVICPDCGRDERLDEHIIKCVFKNNINGKRMYNTKDHLTTINPANLRVTFSCSKKKRYCFCPNPFVFCPFCGDFITREGNIVQ